MTQELTNGSTLGELLRRKIAEKAAAECINSASNDAWMYEDAVVRLIANDLLYKIRKEYQAVRVTGDWEDGVMCGLITAHDLVATYFGLRKDYK
jgi:hypothetical protein